MKNSPSTEFKMACDLAVRVLMERADELHYDNDNLRNALTDYGDSLRNEREQRKIDAAEIKGLRDNAVKQESIISNAYDELNKLREAAQEARVIIGKLQNQVSENYTSLVTMERLEGELSTALVQISEQRQDIENQKQTILQYFDTEKADKNQIANLIRFNDEQATLLQELQAERHGLFVKMNEREQAIAVLEARVKMEHEAFEQLDLKAGEYQARISTLMEEKETKMREHAQQVDRLCNARDEFKDELMRAQHEIEVQENHIGNMEKELSILRGSVIEVQNMKDWLKYEAFDAVSTTRFNHITGVLELVRNKVLSFFK